MDKAPQWIEDFILKSFGQTNGYNPSNFVNTMNEQNDRNTQDAINKMWLNDGHENGSGNLKDQNNQDETKTEVNVKKIKDKKDVGLQIEFSSGKNKEKYICSSIEDFCNGKYVHLKNEPENIISSEIMKDKEYILKYLDASMASNFDTITIESAIDLTEKIQVNSSLLENDYKKIVSKLSDRESFIFEQYLKNKNIKVKASKDKLKYYVDFIKDFKEYKIAANNPSSINIERLRNRVASIDTLNNFKEDLLNEFSNDEILNKIK